MKKFSCDFETTTDPNDCRVWAWSACEIGNIENIIYGTSLDTFMEWLQEETPVCYFHNLKFDGEFIVHWLLTHYYEHSVDPQPNSFRTLISGVGQWYMLEIIYKVNGKKLIKATIYDSLKKLPFSVSKIAKDFNLPISKLKIDYHSTREVDHELTDEEKDYLSNDVKIVALALDIQLNQGLTHMTIGSDALADFKNIITKKQFDVNFPILSLDSDEDIRKAYRGGFTWCNDKIAGQDIGEGIVFDVNSLYPSVMYDKPLPYGRPVYYKGKYEQDERYPLYIQRIECQFKLKPNHIPCIQLKNNLAFMPNEYLKESGDELVIMRVTNVDLALILEHYDVYNLTYIDGFKFQMCKGVFKSYIDKWIQVKINNKGAMKQLAKLMLNSLYGKFATNPKITGKIPYLKNGKVSYKFPTKIIEVDGEEKEVIDEEYRDPVFTPMGVFITSWARDLTIRTAQSCYDRILYCDTDSIHLRGTELPKEIAHIVDDNKLGYWKQESTFRRARFIRQKTYIEEIPISKEDYEKHQQEYNEDKGHNDPLYYIVDGVHVMLNVKCAGMPTQVKSKVTWDNFHIGFKSDGKLLPRHVKGGIVLEGTKFTLK